MRKNIVILGSTGSIGRQTVEVVMAHSDKFKVVGLAGNCNVKKIKEQADILKPDFVCLVDQGAAKELKDYNDGAYKILTGISGLNELCAYNDVDIVLNAIVGSAGLSSTLATIRANKTLALANKESLVAAGDMVNEALEEHNGILIPVDSEHSALWQCLIGEDHSEVLKLIVTASGGPFWRLENAELNNVTPKEALAHPRWTMGKRITIDSATLINKGFEVIEAHHLFKIPYEKIDIVIHPQSIIHSMVQFKDGNIKAQLGPTDMRFPILYSLSWPHRYIAKMDQLDILETQNLELFHIDLEKFGCLKLALEAAGKGESFPAALNAADEIAVKGFLSGKISFNRISKVLYSVLEEHTPIQIKSEESFKYVDDWARIKAEEVVQAESKHKN